VKPGILFFDLIAGPLQRDRATSLDNRANDHNQCAQHTRTLAAAFRGVFVIVVEEAVSAGSQSAELKRNRSSALHDFSTRGVLLSNSDGVESWGCDDDRERGAGWRDRLRRHEAMVLQRYRDG
jgi:hypothetical protein